MTNEKPRIPPDAPITIRPGYADDDRSLRRLAALDSADRPPPAPLLLAEVDGELMVALSLRDGSTVADPFFPTTDILALLRAHAAATSAARNRRGHWVRRGNYRRRAPVAA